MMGLTPRQADCLAFIRERLGAGQVAPSYEEIAAHLGIVKSNAHRMVHALAERGHIRMIRNRVFWLRRRKFCGQVVFWRFRPTPAIR